MAREIAGLVSFLEAHFLSEQIAMRELAYPGYEARVQEPDQAVNLLRALETRWRRGDTEASADILEARRAWPFTRIRTVDRDLAEFVRNRRNAHVE